MKTFEVIARELDTVYGILYNREENFFICPECGEPIYFEEWTDAEIQDGCPICETPWFEEE